MSKKDEDRDDPKDDADLEHEHEEGDDEDEDEEKVVPAKPAADRRRARARALRFEPEDDDHDKGHGHDHDDDDDDEPFEDDDPTWWAPHAVMGGLVVIGVLGFFGVFNRAAAALMGHPQPVAAAVESSAPATVPPPHSGPQPMHPPMPGQPPGQQAKEMFGAKHLLVMYKGSRRAPPNIERTQEDAKKRATEAMKKAKAPGAKFEDLVKEYSDEPGAGARGGDLGKFPKGSMVPEFQTALEKIKVGEVSDVVETPFGYHVILRTQ